MSVLFHIIQSFKRCVLFLINISHGFIKQRTNFFSIN